MIIHLGWTLLPTSARHTRTVSPGNRLVERQAAQRAVPIWSCSRWGLPCHSRCRQRGGLLPHLFTLTLSPAASHGNFGGIFSVALSLGSPPPGVTRHRISLEPGLSSLPRKAERSSSQLTRNSWPVLRLTSMQDVKCGYNDAFFAMTFLTFWQ